MRPQSRKNTNASVSAAGASVGRGFSYPLNSYYLMLCIISVHFPPPHKRVILNLLSQQRKSKETAITNQATNNNEANMGESVCVESVDEGER